MLKRLNSNSSATDSPHGIAHDQVISQSTRFVLESKMSVLLQGFGNSPSGKANNYNTNIELGSFWWWHQKSSKKFRFWLPIAVFPLVLLNSCLIYFVFLHGASENSPPLAPTGAPKLLSDLQNSPDIQQLSAFVSNDLNRNSSSTNSGGCDLSRGEWIPDPTPPLYTNATCDYIQLLQNCLRNGRPDRGYLHWRWRPHGCDLPRFNPATFLQLVSGKKMLFFGDSLARNHMQSLLCSLSQVEKPDKLYSREDKDVKWGFPSYNFTLAIVWSPFLVRHIKVRDEPLLFNLLLDVPHPAWWSSLPDYDFAVFSASQWFFRPSLYSLNNTVFGCNEYSRQNYTNVHFMTAFEAAVRTTVASIAAKPGYGGVTFLRTASPEHFEGGTWSTGGRCNRTAPTVLGHGEVLELPWLPKTFNDVQVGEARRFEPSNGSKMRLLDVTYSAQLRPDGHPGPYRIFQPYREGQEQRQQHVQNDCLHWCLPGPVDMWNELLLEELKRLAMEKDA